MMLWNVRMISNLRKKNPRMTNIVKRRGVVHFYFVLWYHYTCCKAIMHYFNRFMSNTVLFSASQERHIHMKTLLSFFPVRYLTMEPVE
jgi:hypothetical protein